MTAIPNGANAERHNEKDRKSYMLTEQSFLESEIPILDKLESFPRFVTKRSMARFLAKYEIYKKIIDVSGAIIECGVFNGAGLFTWAQLANIFEPTNYTRKVIGFDTFEGFPSVSSNDLNEKLSPAVGDLKGSSLNELKKSIEKYNSERYLSHISNIELVSGDFNVTGPDFLENNKHTLVSLLYLDFDLYEPTKKALELFLPRMGQGSIVCFDELNCSNFPGETVAMLEMFDLKKYKISRFMTDPWISYIIL